MTPLLVVALLLIPASVIVALYLSGRLARAQTPALEPAQLAPAADALLALVLRANQALGVWVLDPARGTTLQALHSGLADSQRDLVLARLEPLVPRVVAAALAATLDDVGGAAIAADIASMRHETQYTRLFRS